MTWRKRKRLTTASEAHFRIFSSTRMRVRVRHGVRLSPDNSHGLVGVAASWTIRWVHHKIKMFEPCETSSPSFLNQPNSSQLRVRTRPERPRVLYLFTLNASLDRWTRLIVTLCPSTISISSLFATLTCPSPTAQAARPRPARTWELRLLRETCQGLREREWKRKVSLLPSCVLLLRWRSTDRPETRQQTQLQLDYSRLPSAQLSPAVNVAKPNRRNNFRGDTDRRNLLLQRSMPLKTLKVKDMGESYTVLPVMPRIRTRKMNYNLNI